MFEFEIWIDGHDHRTRLVAETSGKAKYAYYQYLQDGIWEAPFSEIVPHLRSKKIGVASVRSFFGNPESFARMCEQRNIKFAYQGMRIEVNGKKGTIVGATSSSNLEVVFDGKYHEDCCHPGWETKYFDDDGNVLQDNTVPDESMCVECAAFRSCSSLYGVTENQIGCEFSPTLFRPKIKGGIANNVRPGADRGTYGKGTREY